MPAQSAWMRPSTLFLTVVLAANLMLPAAHFWPSAGASGESAGESRPTVESPRLKLAADARRVTPVTAPPVAKRVAVRQPVPVCLAWGPFADAREAETVARQLALSPASFEIFEAQVSASADFLVTLRVGGSRDAVDRAIRELRSQDVDSYLLRRGEAGNVLAAGVFSRPAGAETRRRHLADLGYDAGVEPLERAHRAYHLMARIPPDQDPQIAPAGHCNDIAPVQQFL
ncbi:MAG: hypothetical protein U5Q16_09520 [Gammaproteobacteria bacterium]|nr:hypothetical protein [Gammaproteobacteria bacterium]